MNIWLGGADTVGQFNRFHQALRAYSHHISVHILEKPAFGYDDASNASERHESAAYDVVHIAPGSGRYGLQELSAAAHGGKVRVVQFWGPEIRTEEIAALRNPYARLIGGFSDPEETREYIRMLARLSPACIVPDFECVAYVRPFFKRVYVLPYAMNTALASERKAILKEGAPLIVHAPVSAHFEGTVYVREALAQLAAAGHHFESIVNQGLSYRERIALYQKADIIIDQLLSGVYGMGAVDAMSLGKPVLTGVSYNYLSYYQQPSIVLASPATLYNRLVDLLMDSGLMASIGEKGAAYAERVHHPGWIANRLEWIYEREAQILSGQLPDEHDVMHNLYLAEKVDYVPIAVSPAEEIQEDGILVEQNERVSSSVYRLYPNRILKRKRGVYVSFNLAGIPADAVISHAIMRMQVPRKAKAVPIYRITRGWDRKTVIRKKRAPRIAKKRMQTVMAKASKGKYRRSGWECTAMAQYWQKEQLANHGVFVNRQLIDLPYLDVTVSI